MSINKAFAVPIEANRKKQETQGKAVLFCEAERFSNRYPKRNAIMKTLWDINLALDNIQGVNHHIKGEGFEYFWVF